MECRGQVGNFKANYGSALQQLYVDRMRSCFGQVSNADLKKGIEYALQLDDMDAVNNAITSPDTLLNKAIDTCIKQGGDTQTCERVWRKY
jgi:hypothetical protein